jgi:diaminopimelate dehydrogenase
VAATEGRASVSRQRLAVIGLGRLGHACGEAILHTSDLQLAGIVRRPESLGRTLPAAFRDVPAVSGLEALDAVDAALLCLPAETAAEAIHDLLQHGVPVVECAAGPDEARHELRRKLHRLALRRHGRVILGAGWDPGALGLFRDLFALLIPKGHTEWTTRPSVSLHHTLTARTVSGVRDALCTELRSVDGTVRRYVYVELAAGADAEEVAAAIRAEPLFLDEETLVLPVESVAALEEQGAGILLQHRGSAAGVAHQLLLLEARFDRWSLAAQVMAAGARALPSLQPGAYLLRDVPLGLLRRNAAAP